MSGSSWRGGKKTASSSAPVSSQRGWKSGKQTPTVRTGSRKKNNFPQIIGLSFALLMLLGITIYAWLPSEKVHTHFVLLNPLEESTRFPFESPLRFPESNIETANWFTVGKKSLTSAPRLDFFATIEGSSEQSHLLKADVCLIFARLFTVPGPQGEHLVLLKNSTPELNRRDQYASLQELKSALVQLHAKNQKLLPLLILDTHAIAPDWRMGYFGDDLQAEVASWRQEIPNLVVILSTGAEGQSWSTGLPGWSGTAFEWALEQALSAAADNNRDDRLTLDEFVQFLQQQTDQWTRLHRHPDGQQVVVIPPLAELQLPGETTRYPTLLRGLKAPTLRVPQTEGNKVFEQRLVRLWEDEARLAAAVPVSQPVLRSTALGRLRRATQHYSRGDRRSAEESLTLAEESFRMLRQFSESTADQQNLVVGHSSAVSELPGVSEWFQAAAINPVENPDQPRERIAELIELNLRAFPFREVGVPAPTADEETAIRELRTHFDRVSGLTFHGATQFTPLLRDLHARLLESEDLLFVRRPEATASQMAATREELRRQVERQLEQLEDFLVLRLRAETLLGSVLSDLPEYLRWAAAQENRPNDELLNALEQRTAPQPPLRAGAAEELPFHLANLLLQTELLLDLTTQQASSKFEKIDQIETSDAALRKQVQQLQTTWQDVTPLAEKLAHEIAGEASARWRESRRALMLPHLTVETRKKLLQNVNYPWPDGGSSEGRPPSAKETGELVWSQFRDRVAWHSLWTIRWHALLQTALPESDGESPVDSMWTAWKSLKAASSSEEGLRGLANLGEQIRSHWRFTRTQVEQGRMKGNLERDAYRQRLWRLELAARFFELDDLDMHRQHRNLREAISQLDQIDSALLLADLAQQTRWMRPEQPNDRPASRWYRQQAQAWHKQTDLLLERSTGWDWIKPELDAAQERLKRLDDWQISLQAPSLLTFENEQQELTLATATRMNGTAPQGLASLYWTGVRPDAASSPILSLTQNGLPFDLQQAEHSLQTLVRRERVPSAENCQVLPLTATLFLRGRTLQQSLTTIDPCPASQRSWRWLATRESAEIKINGSDNRPIMFVVDWSLSMNEADANGQPLQRHIAALNALEEVISKLPQTTRVGLILFGHRSRIRRDGSREYNNQFKLAFDRFMNVEFNFSPLDDVQVIHPISSLAVDRNRIKEKLNALKNVPPWSTTPLGLAMTTAARELQKQGKEGGLVVAITDGAPMDLGDAVMALPPDATPAAVNERKRMHQVRFSDLEKALSPPEIGAVILALDVIESELKSLYCIFGKGEDESVILPGECAFMEANRPLRLPIVQTTGEGDIGGSELRVKIEAELANRTFQILGPRGDVVHEERLRETSVTLDANKTYQVRFANMDLQGIHLMAGDSVSLEPNWSSGTFDVKRNFSTQADSVAARNAATDSDDPALLRARRVRDSVAIGTASTDFEPVTLHTMLDHLSPSRPVQRPAEITFELAAENDPDFRPDAIEQSFTSEFGAPGWKLQAQQWPRNRRVVVNAYWKMERTVPDQSLTFDQLKSAESRETALALGGDNSPLPRCKVWQKVIETGGQKRLEIRIEPEDRQNRERFAALVALTVEAGETSILNDARTFRPDNVTHLKTIVDSGSVVHQFDYPTTEVNLSRKVIALTSSESRRRNAVELSRPIIVTN